MIYSHEIICISMKKHIFVLLSAVLLGGMCGCVQKSSSAQYMTFDTVDYVDGFPCVVELTESKEPEFDVIGINDFCIVDSIMFFSQRGGDYLWSLFSLNDNRLLGRCFTKGTGPGEFVMAPRVAFKTDIFHEKGYLYANIYDFQTGKVTRSDIRASLEQNKNVMTVLCDSLPSGLFSFISISDSVFFCKESSPDFTQQKRYLAGKTAGMLPPVIERLNEAKVSDSKDINIISTIAKMSRVNERIVEMPIGLNYINLYSLNGDFARTVCVGDELDDISEIEDRKEWNRMYTYADLRLFKDFWGVVSINEDKMTFQTGRKKYPSILLFDWDGKPLAELKLTRFVNSFDIDMVNKTLYVFDVYNDKMFAYDLSEVLNKIV